MLSLFPEVDNLEVSSPRNGESEFKEVVIVVDVLEFVAYAFMKLGKESLFRVSKT